MSRIAPSAAALVEKVRLELSVTRTNALNSEQFCARRVDREGAVHCARPWLRRRLRRGEGGRAPPQHCIDPPLGGYARGPASPCEVRAPGRLKAELHTKRNSTDGFDHTRSKV